MPSPPNSSSLSERSVETTPYRKRPPVKTPQKRLTADAAIVADTPRASTSTL